MKKRIIVVLMMLMIVLGVVSTSIAAEGRNFLLSLGGGVLKPGSDASDYPYNDTYAAIFNAASFRFR